MYSHGKRLNGKLYVRTKLGNWIHIKLLIERGM